MVTVFLIITDFHTDHGLGKQTVGQKPVALGGGVAGSEVRHGHMTAEPGMGQEKFPVGPVLLDHFFAAFRDVRVGVGYAT